LRDPPVGIRSKTERPFVVDEITNDDEFADLRSERRQASVELRSLVVHDDDGGDAQVSSR
jgi:hypothetical protein